MTSLLTDRGLLWLGTLLYVAGFIVGCIDLMRRNTGEHPLRVVLNTLLAGGLFFQTAGLYLRGIAVGGCPLGNQFEIVNFVAWSSMVLYFLVGPAFRVSLLGIFTAGYAACLATLALLVPAWDAPYTARFFGNNPWIEFHAALAVFSYGVFTLLALTSVMQLVQNWSLKHKRLNGLFWFLPSLVQLGQINWRLLLAGVGLLTISLAVGASWWLRDTASVDWPKLSVTLGVWIAYLAALLLRWRGVLHSSRFAWCCLALFGAAMLSLGPVSRNHAHQIILTPER